MHSFLSQHPMPRAPFPRGTADAEFRHDLLRTGRLPVQRRGDHPHSRVRFSSVADSVQFSGGFSSVAGGGFSSVAGGGFISVVVVDRFYIALFSALEQTHCARM